ncbi:MAG: 30S ribosomal protein S6 [Planctomycetota bacterium]
MASINVYEALLILDSNKYARDPGGVSGSVNEIIQKCGGEVLVSRILYEQKLAYPIDGHRKGTYWLTYFRLDSAQLTVWNRQCQLNDAIVRQLTLKVDPRLVEALVQNALGNAPIRKAPRIETEEVEVGIEEGGMDEA